MIFNWFKKKKDEASLPEYWKDYSASFDTKQPENINDTRFVVLDTETTGFDFKLDRILSIGAVSVYKKSIEVKDSLEIYLDQITFNPETVKIHGIIKNERFDKLSEIDALKMFLKYIRNSILVAHHASFDIKMLNKALARHGLPKLKNKTLDTATLYKRSRIYSNLIERDRNYSLDEIAETYNIDLTDRHTALGDAYITALIFLKLMNRMDTKKLLITY